MPRASRSIDSLSRLALWLRRAVHALRFCAAAGPGGYRCTLGSNHGGDHIAYADGYPVARWNR